MYTTVRDVNGAAAVEDAVSPQINLIFKYHLWVDPKVVKADTWTDICIPLFIAALFTVDKKCGSNLSGC